MYPTMHYELAKARALTCVGKPSVTAQPGPPGSSAKRTVGSSWPVTWPQTSRATHSRWWPPGACSDQSRLGKRRKPPCDLAAPAHALLL